jgi:hypothetical protein
MKGGDLLFCGQFTATSRKVDDGSLAKNGVRRIG